MVVGMNRIINWLKNLVTSKDKEVLSLVDIRNSDGTPTNLETSCTMVTIEINVKYAKALYDFLKRIKGGFYCSYHGDIINDLYYKLDKQLGKFWRNIKSAPEDDTIIEIMYVNGQTCNGRCVKVVDNGRQTVYYIPISANVNEKMNLIQNNIQPTHWRKIQ